MADFNEDAERKAFERFHVRMGGAASGFTRWSIFNEIERHAAWKAWTARAASPSGWPAGLLDRIKAAEQRVQDNRAPRSIPADPHSDVDLVLAEVRYLIEGQWPPFWLKDTDAVRSCGNCGGTGKRLDDPCSRCNGTGQDKHDPWCVGGEQDGVCNCGAHGVAVGELSGLPQEVDAGVPAVEAPPAPYRCIKPQCPTDCSMCNHAIPSDDTALVLIADLLDHFAVDGHGGPLEDGESAMADRARKFLAGADGVMAAETQQQENRK